MNTRTVTSAEALLEITKILDYLEHDEGRHYAICSAKERRNHIYRSVRRVRKYLEVFTVHNGAIAHPKPSVISTARTTEE